MKAEKIGQVQGGKTGKAYDVYYQDLTGLYRLMQTGKLHTDVITRVVGSPDEAMKAALEDVRAK